MTAAWLWAALLVGCGGGPTMAPDVAAIDRFVHQTHGDTQALTTRGQAVGNALFDVLEGKGSVDAVHAAHGAAVAEIERQRGLLQSYAGPSRPALDRYRESLLAYLDLQQRSVDALVSQGLPVVSDGTRSPADRGRGLHALASASQAEEVAAAARVQAAVEALYATF